MGCEDPGPDFDTAHGAFMDTAAIMRNLDLVITSDTSIPHLAGALDVPVWLALGVDRDGELVWGKVKEMIDRTLDHFGGIDLLVNNAGISPKHQGKKQTLWEMDIAEWDQVMAVNIRGAFLCSRLAVPEMIKRGGGAIVNLASQAAKAGSLITGCHYVISKAGVVGLTKILAREVAEYGIRVNAVAPGRIDTPMIWDVPPEVNEQVRKNIPLKRLGKPEEVAEGILFLLSDSSSFITGFVMDINGGSGMYY